MKANLQRRIQRYGWDRASDYYERYWAKQLQPAQDLMLEMAQLQSGEKVVDIACGTGLVTFRAARQVAPDGHVVGTDISEEMVQTARQIAQRENLNHSSFERMDAEALDFTEDTFDAALDGLGLMYVPDPVNAVSEMKRVLRPEGRAVAAVWGERKNCGWAEIFPIVDSRVKSEVCPLFFQLGGRDMLARTFSQAGFASVSSERISTILYYDSPEDACGAAFAGGPVALAYSRFDDKTRDEAHRDYLDSIEPFRNGNGYEIPGEFVVAIGRKE